MAVLLQGRIHRSDMVLDYIQVTIGPNYKLMSLPALKRVYSRPKISRTKQSSASVLSQRLTKQEYHLKVKNQEIAEQHRNIRLISNYIQSRIIPKNTLRIDSPFRKRIQTERNKDPVKGHFLAPTRIIATSSDKWVIYERTLQRYQRGFKTDQSHIMEGLSKLLVFYCTYVIVSKYELDISKFQCIGTPRTQQIPHEGTIIKADDMISLEALLNIMMLEESLQSEYCLAVNLGLFIYKNQTKRHITIYDIKKKNQQNFVDIFIKFMNSSTQILKLHKTIINDIGVEPSESLNKSCANDIAKLSIQCLKINWIADILKRDTYESSIRFVDEDGQLKHRNISVSGWQANDFLQYRYICRSSGEDFGHSSCSILYETDKISVVIVLLGCYSPEQRQKDIQISIQYFLKKKGLLEQSPVKSKQTRQSIQLKQ